MLMPYLIRGSGEGVALDGFVAASNDDRWLAVVRDGALVLIGLHSFRGCSERATS
jgi:hypothetical protein